MTSFFLDDSLDLDPDLDLFLCTRWLFSRSRSPSWLPRRASLWLRELFSLLLLLLRFRWWPPPPSLSLRGDLDLDLDFLLLFLCLWWCLLCLCLLWRWWSLSLSEEELLLLFLISLSFEDWDEEDGGDWWTCYNVSSVLYWERININSKEYDGIV